MNTAQTHYYICIGDRREGPYDLLSIMRRIRTGRFHADTLICTEAHPAPAAAKDVPEIASLFGHTIDRGDRQKTKRTAYGYFTRGLVNGWRFLSFNTTAAVIAGASVLVPLVAGYVLADFLPAQVAAGVALVLLMSSYWLMHLYMLRKFRGQYIDPHFFQTQLVPILPQLLGTAVLVAVISLVGFTLLLIPGIVLLSLVSFTPFLMLDRGLKPGKALEKSVKLIWRDSEVFGAVFGLTTLNIFAMMLLVPLPLLLPITLSALAEIYDEIGH